MRKLLTTLFTVLITTMVSAQTGSGHIEFKGVPVDGALNEFVANMESAGFKTEGIKDGIAVLRGDFAGEKNCKINVITLMPQNLVNKITVYFPAPNSWADLHGTYSKLKLFLTEKYGAPHMCVEKFLAYSVPETDMNKMMYARIGKCNYVTSFAVPNGYVNLSIYSGEMQTEPCVKLVYADNENSEIIRQQIMDDL